ncbi:MAG: hypothetical protein RBR35_18800 [Salinivirgaceae bacterium]|nr:hypothetical protein [Salinivirgaceae bacterium]
MTGFTPLGGRRFAGPFNPKTVPETLQPNEQCHFNAPPSVVLKGKTIDGGLFMTEEEKMQVALMDRATDRVGYLIRDLLYMGLPKLATEIELFRDWLKVRLEFHRDVPTRKPERHEDIPFYVFERG